ncbi:MAG: hypothetical protein IKW08_03965 [Roseburia sp.]|nr:hypothetical protein [Roseburia sp.]
MTNVTQKRLGLGLTMLLIIVSVFCGCQSMKGKIAGRWEKIEGSGLSTLEFFSNGTYTSDSPNYSGSYSIDGNRIRLEGILVETKVYTFEVDGNSLSLENDSGTLGVYKKIN